MKKKTRNIIIALAILLAVFFIGRIFIKKYEANVAEDLDHIAQDTREALDKNFDSDLDSEEAQVKKEEAESFVRFFEDIGFVFEIDDSNDKHTIYEGHKDESQDTLRVDIEILADPEGRLSEINTKSPVATKVKKFTVAGFYTSLPYNILGLDQEWFQANFQEAVKKTAKDGAEFSNVEGDFETNIRASKEILEVNIKKK